MALFNSLNMNIFDSNKASFKLSIEASFTRKADDSVKNLVYVTSPSETSKGGYGVLNPAIFLTFTRKMTDRYNDDRKIYTSYPHLYTIRKILSELITLIETGEGFTRTASGDLVVREEYREPRYMSNIGRESKWISFSLTTFNEGEDGSTTKVPGVMIEMSVAEGYPSLLSLADVSTIYGVLSTLDLINLSATFSTAYLLGENMGSRSNVYSGPANPSMRGNSSGFTGGYAGERRPTGSVYGATAAPRSASAPRGWGSTNPSYGRNPAPVNPPREEPMGDPVEYDHTIDDSLPWYTSSSPAPTQSVKADKQRMFPADPSDDVGDLDLTDASSIADLFDENNS